MTIPNPVRERDVLNKMRIMQTRIFVLAILPVIFFNDPALYGDMGKIILQALGLLCLIICAFGRSFCSVYIGGRKNTELVMVGIFSIVRNPLYVFSFIGTIGVGLWCGSLMITIALMVIFALYYSSIVAKEEHYLLLKFSDAYRAYMQQVPRWIPAFRQWNSPEIIETKPLYVLKTFCDASGFFAVIPFIQLVEWLHAHEVLPVFFRLL